VEAGDRALFVKTTAGPDHDNPTLVVSLDGIETWDPPGQGPAMSIEELKIISMSIERAARRFGISVEFG
jgi:Immunity protein 74